MTIQDILNDIDSEKQKALSELEASLATKLAELDAEQEKKKEGLKEDYKERVAKKASSIEKKMQAKANMEKKTLILAAKREALESAFDEAIKALVDSNDYTDTLTKLIANADLKDATVIAAKGKKPETINALKAAKKDYKVTNEGSFSGGVILQGSDVEVDLSFETLVNELRGDLETDIAHKLFN